MIGGLFLHCLGIAAEQQNLLLNSKRLEDSQLFFQVGIVEGSMLQITPVLAKSASQKGLEVNVKSSNGLLYY
jgi:hypothetical protein